MECEKELKEKADEGRETKVYMRVRATWTGAFIAEECGVRSSHDRPWTNGLAPVMAAFSQLMVRVHCVHDRCHVGINSVQVFDPVNIPVWLITSDVFRCSHLMWALFTCMAPHLPIGKAMELIVISHHHLVAVSRKSLIA